MRKTFQLSLTQFLLCTAAFTLTSAHAFAQADTQASAGAAPQLEEVTVSAERRTENAQKVPVALAVRSGDALASANITDTSSLSQVVPGLQVETNTGQTQIFIRGIGTTGKSIDNDVGLYIDGVYIASEAGSLMNVSDIDHIEVLKGPQGTLFGRNTIGGVVQVITKTPSQTPSADFEVGYGNYNTVTTNFYVDTGVTDNLATNFAGYYSDQGDGWGRDLVNGRPLFTSEVLTLRNKWLWTPDANTTVTLSADFEHNRSMEGLGFHILPGSLGVDGVTTDPGFYNSTENGKDELLDNQWGTSLNINHDFGWAQGVSITAYRQSIADFKSDHDATPLPISYVGPTRTDDKTFSQELQLLSPEGSKVKWITGLYYMNDDLERPFFDIVANNGHTVQNLVTDLPTKSYAAYAQATFEILEDTHVTGGIRYTLDSKEMDGATYVNGVFKPTTPAHQADSFSKVTYHLVLDHQFTPDIYGYLSYDTGYKSGQYNSSTYTAAAVLPEGLKAYQGGVKTNLFDDRLQFNVAGFYYDYSNIQINTILNATNFLYNAAEATMYGADVDVEAVITSQLTLTGSLSLLHGRYGKFDNAVIFFPNPAGGNTQGAFNGKGQTTVNSPSATAYLAAEYAVPIDTGSLELNANVSYNSGYYWDPDNRVKQPSYSLLGGFARWTAPSGKWDVRLWGNNLTGTKHYSWEDAYADGDVGSPAAPRTYGVTVGLHF